MLHRSPAPWCAPTGRIPIGGWARLEEGSALNSRGDEVGRSSQAGPIADGSPPYAGSAVLFGPSKKGGNGPRALSPRIEATPHHTSPKETFPINNDTNSPDETPESLGQCRTLDPSVYPFFMILMHTGVRVCEVLDLKGPSVDVRAGTLAIASRKTNDCAAGDDYASCGAYAHVLPKDPSGCTRGVGQKLGLKHRNRVRHPRSRERR